MHLTRGPKNLRHSLHILPLGATLVALGCGSGHIISPDGGAGRDGAGDAPCVALTCQAQNKSCGQVADGCGGTLECGTCAAPQTCGGAGTDNVCGCTPTTCAAQGKNCGTMPDGCAGTLACGSCTLPEECGGGDPGAANVCGEGPCTTGTTCEAEGKNCDRISDGCSGTLDCGTCTAPDVCGGDGVANVCGCSPTTCAALGKNCGSVGDGCGGTLDCGGCTDPQTCGGGGTANVCGGGGGTSCSEGAIPASGCTCGGAPHTDGYCCGNQWQATECSTVVDLSAFPSDRLTPWNPGIQSDGLLSQPLGADGLPQRTTVCATLNPGDNIQNAINGCPEGQVVKLNPGLFSVSATVQLKNGVVLRGSGSQGAPSGTTVKTSNGGVLAIGSSKDGACHPSGTAYPLTADALNGSYQVTVGTTNASKFTAGNLAIIDTPNAAQVVGGVSIVDAGDCTYNNFMRAPGRNIMQVVEIASVDTGSGVLTLTSAVHWDFKAASPYSSMIQPVTGTIRWAGIESLRVQDGMMGYNGQYGAGIDIANAAHVWVKDVQTGGSIRGMHVALAATYGSVVRDSYVHHSGDYNYAADCYGIVTRCGSADNLIENNIVRYMNKPVLFNVSGGGNVLGYNYVDNAWAEGTWQETPVDCHCAFPHMELMEGNWAPKMGATTTHGNAGYLMYFRNYSSSQYAAPAYGDGHATQVTGNLGTLDFRGDYAMTVVGNVLGAATAGTSPASNGYESGSVPIYLLDAFSTPSVYRHGNYDYFNNTTNWDATNSSRALPPSLYLRSKPAFFGGNPWPWVGPDLSPMVSTLPAKARSDADYNPPVP